MTALALYQCADDVIQALENGFDEETGEIREDFAEKRDLFTNKAAQVAAYVLNQRALGKMLREHITQIQHKLSVAEYKADAVHDYLLKHMKRTGITEIKSADGTFSAKLYPERDESVELDNIEFPPELCNDPKPPTPSKTKIKAAILAGQPVAGARIVRKDRLTIK